MTRPRLLSIISLLLTLLFCLIIVSEETHASTNDLWWDRNWHFRIPLQVSEPGTVENTLNFSQILVDMGLEDALLDLRSLQVIPYIDGIPGEPVPFEETFSQLLTDADELVIDVPPNTMFWQILEESTTIEIDNTQKTQGDGSLHALIEMSETSNTQTGFYFNFNDSSYCDWSRYEVLLYDFYPDVHEITPFEITTFFTFRLEGLANCPSKNIDGPSLITNSWNGVDLILQPFGMCENPGYSNIDMMKFIFTRESNNYLEMGDILDIWVDNFRIFDQDADGQIIWNAEESVDYYLYFNLLRYGDSQTYLPLVFQNN